MFKCEICGSSLDVEEALDSCPECRPAEVWDLASEEDDWPADDLRAHWLQFGFDSDDPLPREL